jgi:O-antigen/teichoic acid export membrane protein
MSVVAGAIVNVVFNIILIPFYGANGAAISTLVAEIIVCLFQSYNANNDMNLRRYINDMIPYMFLAMLMLLVIRNITLESDIFTIIIRIIVGGLVYVIPSFLLFRKKWVVYQS